MSTHRINRSNLVSATGTGSKRLGKQIGQKKKLTARQERMMSFITNFMSEFGYPPTVRDIQYGCDLSSTSVVDYNLNILQRDGRLKRSSRISRGIELPQDRARGRRDFKVSILGYIAAGEPIPVPDADTWSEPDPIDILDLSSVMTGPSEEYFALKVRGDSMIDAYIEDGDVVVMRIPRNVKSGDMVAVWLKTENEATLKRFYKEGDNVRLQPENREMKPIFVKASNVVIQGKVVAVIRHLV